MTAPKRRIFLKSVFFSIATVSPVTLYGQEQPAQGSEHEPDLKAADDWMQAWMNVLQPDGTKAPRNTLHLSRFADPMYFTTKEFGWDPEDDKVGTYPPVRVPVGFVTDFASIPRLFWSTLRPDGTYSYAAAVHDYLYWAQPVPRNKADEIFKFLMQDFKINEVIVSGMYNAVRLGGFKAWNDNAKRRAEGEKRILMRFPDDPTVRWADWKQRSDVF